VGVVDLRAEPQDRLAFEEHLAGCPECAAELAELSGMAQLLSDLEPVPPAGAEPPAAGVVDLVKRRAASQRHRTRWQAAVGVAAAIVLLAGGVAVGLGTAKPAVQTTTGLTMAGQRHSATGTATGVKGEVGLVAKPWGTQVILDLAKVKGPLECDLVAVSRSGERRVMVGWLVPAAGYGVPGHPANLLLEGGTSIKIGNLAHIDVDVVHGRTLVSIPV
jgi:predicted anti-sigma-YlaC factor YlaD